MSGAGSRLPVLLLLFALAFPPQPASPQQAEWPESHRRMQELLAEVARTMPHADFFGARVPELEAELAALLADAGPLARVPVQGTLGEALLKAGDLDRAVEVLDEVAEALFALPEPPVAPTLTTVFLLGVAHLRRGIDANCVAELRSDACILPIVPGGLHTRREETEAAAYNFTQIVRSVPESQPIHVAARWLLNIAAMFLGDYPQGVPAELRIDPSVFVSPAALEFPRFRNVAPQAGLATLSQAGGAVVDDFDGDLLLDVMVSSLDPAAPLRIFRNRGDGRFDDVSDAMGPAGITGGLNLVPADYDNDGDLDIYVLRGAWLQTRGRWPNSLLRHDGDRWVDVTLEVGLGDVHYPTQTAAWADFDLDGDVDLYVGNETIGGLVAPGQLFENRDGRFVDIAAAAGVENLRFAKGVAWGDYDGDGDPDLWVSNMGEPNRLYRNEGDGTFRDVAPALGMTRPDSAFVPWFWDVDNDGALDLLVNTYQAGIDTGAAPPVWYVASARIGGPYPGLVPALYLNDGAGGFRDVAGAWGIATPTLPMGANFGDLDQDGYPDFYLGTGYPGLEGLIPNVMYRNVGGTGFEEVTFVGGFGHLAKGHGIVFADLDNDGDSDVFEQLGGLAPADQAYDVLFENPGFGRRWLKLEAVAADGRTAHGTRIEVRLVEGERTRSVFRTVGDGGSFGAGPRRLEFGLGEATAIDEIRVRWPGGRDEQVFSDVALDRFYKVRQDDDRLEEIPLPSFAFSGTGAGPTR